MPKTSKKSDFVKSTLKAKKLCPHCGHDDFRTIPTRFSWLLGQTFLCSKCQGTFKKANLVKVNQLEKQYGSQQFGRPKPKKRRHK
jgi:hypothetical protein